MKTRAGNSSWHVGDHAVAATAARRRLLFFFVNGVCSGSFHLVLLHPAHECAIQGRGINHLLVADGLVWIRGRRRLSKGAGEVPCVEPDCNMRIEWSAITTRWMHIMESMQMDCASLSGHISSPRKALAVRSGGRGWASGSNHQKAPPP